MIFHEFYTDLVLFMKTFCLRIVRNNILACLLPNCSNQLLFRDIISHLTHLLVTYAEFIYFHVFNCMLYQKCVTKKRKCYMQLFYYFTLTPPKKACEISKIYPWIFCEIQHVFKKPPHSFGFSAWIRLLPLCWRIWHSIVCMDSCVS